MYRDLAAHPPALLDELWSGTIPMQTVSPLTQELARACAHLLGWQIEARELIPPRCVIIGAHHTTGWDLPAAILLMLATNTPFRWVGKDALFRGAQGWLLRHIGGIPVNRATRCNFVGQVVAMFAAHAELRVALCPEGTRQRAAHWRTGFYYIALGAGVPIVLGYADYARKQLGFGPILTPSGDIEADFALIRAFYAGKTARHPERQSEICLGAHYEAIA
jgi:1-acyl-sn-glycerol-3-phosphate acyltransferase